MESIRIDVFQQMDGINFSITSQTIRELKSYFPNASPIRKIYITNDILSDFSRYKNSIKNHIIPALLGSNQSEIEKIKHIDVINYDNGKDFLNSN